MNIEIAPNPCIWTISDYEDEDYESMGIEDTKKTLKFKNQATQATSQHENHVYLNVTYNTDETSKNNVVVDHCFSSTAIRCILILIVVAAIILSVLVFSDVTLTFIVPVRDVILKEIIINSTTTASPIALFAPDLLFSENKLKIISREDWGARQPKQFPEKTRMTSTFVIITETGTELCLKKSQCMQSVRYIQDRALASKYYSDIENHFIVGGDGLVYEGRGWGMVAQVSNGFIDQMNFGISVIGNFTLDEPTEKQLSAILELIKLAVKKNIISTNYRIQGLKWSEPSNPGKNLLSKMKKWLFWAGWLH